MADVAAAAQVSKATVSNVLSGKTGHVSESVSRRVLEAAKRLHYQPRIASGVLLREKTIAVLIDLSETFHKNVYRDMVTSIVSACQETPYRVVFYPDREGKRDYEAILLDNPSLDGVIIHCPLFQDKRMETLMASRLPTVSIGSKFAESRDRLVTIDVDNIQIAYDTTLRLLQLGHRKIGLLNSRPNCKLTFDRLRGYVGALKEYEIPFDPALVYNTDNMMRDGADTCFDLIRLQNVTAVVTCSDDVARGVYEAAKKFGLAIPRDLSVCALGGDDFAASLQPALDTVAIPYWEIGELAVEQLIGMIEGKTSEGTHIEVDAHYLHRHSVAAVRPNGLASD